jgi:phosphoribosyl 1,2-cyclic phosphodiesterase
VLTFSLQSGSNGNSFYVEANGTKLLFDAGITGKTAERRMAIRGRDIREVDAVIVSHDHTDHIRYAGVYQRKFGLPIYITRRTRLASWWDLGEVTDVRYFNSGDRLTFGHVTVHTIPTAHDAADGVAFVVECEGKRLAILTDLGHPFAGLQSVMESVDAAYLESNYDPTMLARGRYPYSLQARIRGPGGHLSNGESADLLKACSAGRPKWVAVAHLSAENNLPELAVEAQHRAVGRDYPVFVAGRDRVSEVLSIG